MSLAVNACNGTFGHKGVVPSAPVFGEVASLLSFLGPKVPRTTLSERAQVALAAHRIIAEFPSKVKIETRIRTSITKNAELHIFTRRQSVSMARKDSE